MMRSRPPLARVIGGGLFAVLVGCASPLPKVDAPLPAQWQHAEAAEPARPSDLQGWWHAFHDPQLDALVDRALASNLDVAEAVERLRAVRALHRTAQTRYLPTLRARTSDVVEPSANASYQLFGFDASWEFGLFGRAEGSRREASGALDASIADLRIVQVSLVAEVVREWIELRTAQQQEQLLLQIAEARRQEWTLLQVRQHLQLVASSAVDQAQVAMAQSSAALAEPRQAITASTQQLAMLLGQNRPDAAWLQPGKPPELGAWHLDSAPADLVRTRPEIARAEADVIQAAGAQALANADQFPSIGLGGSIDWSIDIDNDHKHSTSPNFILSVGPELNIPLFDWGIRLAAKHAKDHELKASVLAYRQAVLKGVADVETSLSALQQQAQREQQISLAREALQRVDRAVQDRVRLRLDSPLDRVESQIALEQADAQLAQARAERSVAYVALFKALGGAPLPTPAQLGVTTPKTSDESRGAIDETTR
jgi:multidrug efflux system outer membrane protein